MKQVKVLIHADEHREAVFTVVDTETMEHIDGVQDVRVEPIIKDGKNTFTYQAIVTLIAPAVDMESEHESEAVEELLEQALSIDGMRHKQWYLWRIAEALKIELPDDLVDKGIAP